MHSPNVQGRIGLFIDRSRPALAAVRAHSLAREHGSLDVGGVDPLPPTLPLSVGTAHDSLARVTTLRGWPAPSLCVGACGGMRVARDGWGAGASAAHAARGVVDAESAVHPRATPTADRARSRLRCDALRARAHAACALAKLRGAACPANLRQERPRGPPRGTSQPLRRRVHGRAALCCLLCRCCLRRGCGCAEQAKHAASPAPRPRVRGSCARARLLFPRRAQRASRVGAPTRRGSADTDGGNTIAHDPALAAPRLSDARRNISSGLEAALLVVAAAHTCRIVAHNGIPTPILAAPGASRGVSSDIGTLVVLDSCASVEAAGLRCVVEGLVLLLLQGDPLLDRRRL
mmetsp:Transcript_2941/g.7287  ORF Transcript_2941/g.7287 Transcript_2941/m.7287 type:complete len:347 (-) Transcript_2941:88-1128(-)